MINPNAIFPISLPALRCFDDGWTRFYRRMGATLFATTLFGVALFAQLPVRLEGEKVPLLAENIATYRDGTMKENFESVKTRKFDVLSSTQVGLANEALWLRVVFESPAPANWVMESDDSLIPEMDAYLPDSLRGYRSFRMGLARRVSERPIKHRIPLFPLDGADTVYIRIHSFAPLTLRLTAYSRAGLEIKEKQARTFHGFVYGALAMIFFYNFFLGVVLKQRIYFIYVGSIALMAHTFSNLWGYSVTYLWAWMGPFSGPMSMGLVFVSMFFITEFSLRYLSIREYSSWAYRALRWAEGAMVVGAVWGWTIFLFPVSIRPYWNQLLFLTVFVVPIGLLSLAVWLHTRGNASAPSYVLAFSALVGGAFVLSLRNFGVLPTNMFTENGVIIGSLLEGAILAVGLGQKMNRLSLERERAQAQTIAALQEKERLIVEQNLTLEQKVRERTDELKRANEELNSTNEELHATLEHVTHQNRVIERKNADILESIRYALRIQTAILPEEEFIGQSVPEFFVFYRPKDVVSGDFYWFGYLEKEDAVAVAVVDCTGHGVPGAFMSVVGYNQLNRAVLEMRLTNPAEILTELDARIRQTLKQEVGSDRYDGMDLGLCVWLRKENRLLFAGAQRPLYYFDSDGTFACVSGDKFPVGGAQARDKRFTTREIPLRGRQRFYLFSDGFTDQFGGPNKRKFAPKRFQELLSQIHGLNFSEQGIRVQTAFDDWKGTLEQLDDVCVFGFSLAERR